MAPQDHNYKGSKWDPALDPALKLSPSLQRPQVSLGESCQDCWKPQPVSSCFPVQQAAFHSIWLPPIPVTRSPALRYLPGWPGAMPIDGGQPGMQIFGLMLPQGAPVLRSSTLVERYFK